MKISLHSTTTRLESRFNRNMQSGRKPETDNPTYINKDIKDNTQDIRYLGSRKQGLRPF